MRQQLRPHFGTRQMYTGTVQRFASRLVNGERVGAVCFENVVNTGGQLVADHVWIDLPAFDGLDLRIGEDVTFTAEAVRYRKGRTHDYKLDKVADACRVE